MRNGSPEFWGSLDPLLDNYLDIGERLPVGLAVGCYVALAADDSHRSAYTDALALIRKYRVPMTFSVYPSAVSNAFYAMAWDQMRGLKATGFFDIQSHTYWHPNFKKERERLPPAELEKLVRMQLTESREKLEKEKGVYTIAHIMVFKDNALATARPDLAANTRGERCGGTRRNSPRASSRPAPALSMVGSVKGSG